MNNLLSSNGLSPAVPQVNILVHLVPGSRNAYLSPSALDFIACALEDVQSIRAFLEDESRITRVGWLEWADRNHEGFHGIHTQ